MAFSQVNEALKKEGVDFQIWATAIKNFLEIPSPVTEIDDATGRLFDFLNQAVMTIDVNHCLAIVEGKVINGFVSRLATVLMNI